MLQLKIRNYCITLEFNITNQKIYIYKSKQKEGKRKHFFQYYSNNVPKKINCIAWQMTSYKLKCIKDLVDMDGKERTNMHQTQKEVNYK